ncbi:MAG: signal peptidase I [Theionarchaea archaeon]|nr:signal peptidase I [Theionarchaea archaeon]
MPLSSTDLKKELINVGIAILIFCMIQGILYATLGVFPPYRVISSGSMEPVYHEGDIIFIKDIAPQSIENGDIIVFKARNGTIPIVHRVIEIIEENGNLYFVTKGDNNPFSDSYYSPGIPESSVIGTPICKIPKIGWISLFLRRII